MSTTPSPEQREALRQRALAIETANVADVLDEMGLPHQGLAPDFAPASPGRLAGFAYTITGEMVPYEGGGDPRKMEACGGVSQGEITVWAGGASGVCYFGELIALGLAERGCVGALVDGGVRDTRWLEQHQFPVRARYVTPIQSIGRWRVTDWQVPVYVPGATVRTVVVHPGDLVLADEDGAIVVPGSQVEDVIARTEQMSETETAVRQAIAEGMSLSQALERFGHV